MISRINYQINLILQIVLNHINEDTSNLNDHDNVQNGFNIEDVCIDDHLVPPLDIYDPRNYGNLKNKERDILVEKWLIRDIFHMLIILER